MDNPFLFSALIKHASTFGHRKLAKHPGTPEPLNKSIELIQYKLNILRTHLESGKCAALQMVLYLPGNRFRKRALLWVAAQQTDHAASRHSDIQAGRRRLPGKDLWRIPVPIRATDRTDALACFVRVKNGVRPVDENDAMLLRVNKDMRWEHRTVEHNVGMRQSERNEQTPPDPG